MHDQSRTDTGRMGAIAPAFLCALCIACFSGSTASGTVASTREERPAFQREWVAAATGTLAAGNLIFVFDHRSSPSLAFAGIGSSLLLASTDEGKMSDTLAAAGFVLAVSQLFGVKRDGERPDHEPIRKRLQFGVTADLQRLLLQYRF